MSYLKIRLSPSCFYDDGQVNLNIWWQGCCVIAVLLALNVLLYALDPRLLGDEALWLKPIKFELSLIVHFATLAILASLLSPARRNSKTWQVMSYLVVAAALFETLYIFLQAARGRESHFNFTTSMESTMYALMGIGALLLVIGSFYLGCLLFREYQSKQGNVIILASALGLSIGSALTLIVAGYLSSPFGGYEIISNADTPRFPIFSWYLDGRDLRIPHFLATHMMQLIPLYGLWLSQRDVSVRGSKTRVFIATGIYSCIVVTLFLLGLSMK